EFNNYAQRFLGLNDAIRKPSHEVVIKSVTINTRGTADPANRWTAQFKPGTPVSMTLTEDGVPLSINTGGVIPPTPQPPTAKAAAPSPLDGPAAREAVTEEMTRATTQSKKAEMTAARIFELRERRSEIFNGDADNLPPDGKATEIVLSGLSAQEAALTAMFAGVTTNFTEVSTVTFNPGREEEPKALLTRVSPLDGVVAKDDLSGIPVYIRYEILSMGKLPVNEKGEVKKFPKGGVAYNIPGTARISIIFNNQVLASADIDVAQLGTTFGIDPALFTDKKAPASAVFSPVTGAIVQLSATTTER
ncbi:MAG: DUF4831 family protein, partial [Muribaculaceae bacterium]|nr:DUF4831 family protein [Muribaculaceae bacterium]